MNKHRLVRRLLALRPADWSEAERAQVERHLTSCTDCAAIARAYARQDQLISRLPPAYLTPSQRAQLLARISQERRRHDMRTRLSVIVGTTLLVTALVMMALVVKALLPQTSPSTEQPVTTTGELTPAQPLAQTVPFTVCRSSETWIRPGEAEQAAEVWDTPRRQGIPREMLWWNFQQSFYRYYGGNSELSDAWPEAGLWTASEEDVTGLCERENQNLVSGQEIELWVLLHRVIAVQQEGGVYTVTVQPTPAGYQIIRVPAPHPAQPSETPVPRDNIPLVTVHFVDTEGHEIDHLPKTPPWAAIPTTQEVITVTGTVVDNAASAQVVTLNDAEGTTWSIPWLEGTIVRRADGSPAQFQDITPGMALEVTGFRSADTATPNTLAAVRVVLFERPGTVTPTAVSFLCPPASSSGTEWQCRENAPALTRTCTPVSSAERGGACYEDLKYGFAVEYPTSDLEVSIPIDEHSSNGVTILRRHSFEGQGGVFLVDITPMFEPDLVTWMEKMRRATGPNLYPAMEPNATVGGYPAVAFTDNPMTISPMFTVLVSNGTYVYSLLFTLRCDDEDIAVMQRFLDSFRFSTESVPAEIPQTVWENVRRAYTRCEIPIETWSFPSPDGKWTANVIVALPVISSTTVSNQYYTRLELLKTDGTKWTIVDEWSEWGLGYTIPSPLQWSHDGKYLYFTNKPIPDGCAVFVNGADLHRVDLDSGSVSPVVPSVGLWLSLSPDETMLAYIGYGDRGLVIRDLATGTEREIKLNPGQEYQAGHITWSPDGSSIVLALAIHPCSTDWADSTSIVHVDVATLEQVTLIQEDKRLFVPVEWTMADQVLLKDGKGDYWFMDATTGQVTQK